MTTTEQQLLDVLLELESAIDKVNDDPKPDLMAIFSRLDDLSNQMPKDASPDLLHYLHNFQSTT